MRTPYKPSKVITTPPLWQEIAQSIMEKIQSAGGIMSWTKMPKHPGLPASLIWNSEIQDILKKNHYHFKMKTNPVSKTQMLIVKSPEYIKEVLRTKMKQEFEY